MLGDTVPGRAVIAAAHDPAQRDLEMNRDGYPVGDHENVPCVLPVLRGAGRYRTSVWRTASPAEGGIPRAEVLVVHRMIRRISGVPVRARAAQAGRDEACRSDGATLAYIRGLAREAEIRETTGSDVDGDGPARSCEAAAWIRGRLRRF